MCANPETSRGECLSPTRQLPCQQRDTASVAGATDSKDSWLHHYAIGYGSNLGGTRDDVQPRHDVQDGKTGARGAYRVHTASRRGARSATRERPFLVCVSHRLPPPRAKL